MQEQQIIVIGAGAAGLMAAYKLSRSGKKVLVLEARDRTGGRIHTIYNKYGKIELGAEFVHGDLPVTLDLLNEAGIKYSAAGGDFWRFKKGKLSQEDEQVSGWEELTAGMKKLEHDITLNEFLDSDFSGDKYEELRKEVRRYVSGYDTADSDKVSVFALRDEWLNEDEDAQHRLDGGYMEMINYFADQISELGGKVLLGREVKLIKWSSGSVEVTCANDEMFKGLKVIVALPLGVLQNNGLSFQPQIPEQLQAFNQIGFGAIIKVLLRFKRPFWEEVDIYGSKEMGFVLSEEHVPTWWTQMPKHENLLTGWLGGNPAKQVSDFSNEELLQLALQSLENIFNIAPGELRKDLTEWHIANWTTEPFTQGSYAYDMVGSARARQLLMQALKETIYFAGEYLYHGPAMGTVEAALTSGRDISDMILKK